MKIAMLYYDSRKVFQLYESIIINQIDKQKQKSYEQDIKCKQD